jgi:hypothetical protein
VNKHPRPELENDVERGEKTPADDKENEKPPHRRHRVAINRVHQAGLDESPDRERDR